MTAGTHSPKGELFLTSSIHAVARDIAGKLELSKANILVFITTASEPKGECEDLEWQKIDRQALVDAGFVVSNYTITGKTSTELEAELEPFDYIYLSGGDTFYLLRQSQKTGFIPVIRKLVQEKGKVYIGTSAGSIITGPKLMEYHGASEAPLDDRSTYGLVNFTVIPHWGSEEFKGKYLGGRMATIYSEQQVPLILLTDSQYIHVQNGSIEVIDTGALT